MNEERTAERDAFCLCGLVDDLGDGTCGNCGLRIMTEDDEARVYPPVVGVTP